MRTREDLLKAAAQDLARDLERRSDRVWSCRIDSNAQLSVLLAGQVVAQEPVERDFYPDNWPPEALEARWLDSTQEDDASEAVADALAEAIEQVDGPWPTCPNHPTRRLTVCSGTWTCPDNHDLASIGNLTG